jgi:hypothetical protein
MVFINVDLQEEVLFSGQLNHPEFYNDYEGEMFFFFGFFFLVEKNKN